MTRHLSKYRVVKCVPPCAWLFDRYYPNGYAANCCPKVHFDNVQHRLCICLTPKIVGTSTPSSKLSSPNAHYDNVQRRLCLHLVPHKVSTSPPYSNRPSPHFDWLKRPQHSRALSSAAMPNFQRQTWHVSQHDAQAPLSYCRESFIMRAAATVARHLFFDHCHLL